MKVFNCRFDRIRLYHIMINDDYYDNYDNYNYNII